MSRVIISGEPLVNRTITGINRVAREILRELDKIAEPKEFEVVIPKSDDYVSEFTRIAAVRKGVNWYAYQGLKAKILSYWWRNILFRVYCVKRRALSVNISTPNRGFVTDIISIYDCRAVLFPHYSLSRSEKRWQKDVVRNQRRSVPRCKLVMTDSESAKADIVRLYGVDESKVLVVPCGWQHFERVEEDGGVLGRLGLEDGGYFFSLGSRMPHKNIRWVSCAAAQNPRYRFVVSGKPPSSGDVGFEGEKPPNMTFPGYLSDGEVKALMRHCRAFIQPSLYEGFGLPPMEAMSVGADCIVSDRGALPEVYGDSVWYIDPEDYEGIDLDEIMSRPKQPNERVLERYSWEKSARIFLDAIKGFG